MLNELEVMVLNNLIDRYLEVRDRYFDLLDDTDSVELLLWVTHEKGEAMGRIDGVLKMIEMRLGTTVELNWDMAVDDNIRKVTIAGYNEQLI